MAVYSKSGELLQTVYGTDGYALAAAYNKSGEQIHPDGPVSLRVCSYNVGGWYIGSGTNVPANLDASFYALQNGMISAIDADILCMQEYWNNFSPSRTAVSLLQQYYPYIHAENGSTTYVGRCICSKYPIKSYTQHIYTGDTAGRYYDEAVITIGAVDVHVFVTHLHPSDQSEKIRTAKILFDYTQTLTNPWIVCGDFNSTLYDPMSETNVGIYKQFLDVGCTIANDGAFGILPTACNSASWANDKFAIDNIICSSGITIDDVDTNLAKITNADVLAAGKIDHVPLFADVEI